VSSQLPPLPARAICSNKQVDRIGQKITVLIDSKEPGSGVIISRQGRIYTVLTAYHVVKNPKLKYRIVMPDHQSYELISIKRLDNNIDLAVVEFTSNRDYQQATLGNSDEVKRLDTVHVSGFPYQTAGVKASIYDCRSGEVIENVQKPIDHGYSLFYDNPTLGGMSGGAVLNDRGEVLGIHGQGEESSDVDIDKINPEIAIVKSGRNAAIPINVYKRLAAKNRININIAATPNKPTTSAPVTPPQPSEVSSRYSKLSSLLASGNWQEADKETKYLILLMTQNFSILNEQAISQMSCQTLSAIDQLWRSNSQDRFGFAIQARKWRTMFGNKFETNNRNFEDFATELGWRDRGIFLPTDRINYSLTAPKGHLPKLFLDGPIWGRFIQHLDSCKICLKC
jgi:hypothetical protein